MVLHSGVGGRGEAVRDTGDTTQWSVSSNQQHSPPPTLSATPLLIIFIVIHILFIFVANYQLYTGVLSPGKIHGLKIQT